MRNELAKRIDNLYRGIDWNIYWAAVFWVFVGWSILNLLFRYHD